MGKRKRKIDKKIVIMSFVLFILMLTAGIIFFNQYKSGKGIFAGNSDKDEKKDEPVIERGEDGLPDFSTANPEDFLTFDKSEEKSGETTVKAAVKAPVDEFQGELQETGLVIQGIQSYSGIFIEKNEDSECKDVAVAMLENKTGKMISLAIVSISVGESEWKFEASTIPAGASVIVQEKNGKKYVDEVVNCKKVEIAYAKNTSRMEDKISVEELGDNKLKITNISKKNIPAIRLFYKLKEDNVYFGGITYTVKIDELLVGESTIVCPVHYTKGNSEILMIKEYEE